MPAAILVPLIAAAATSGTALVAAKMQNNSNRRATDANARATDQAMTLERDNETRRRQEYDQQQAELQRQWQAEQDRRAPYRQLSDLILRQRAERRGLQIDPASRPTSMPTGWAPTVATPQVQQPQRPMTLADLARQRQVRY